MLLGVLSGALNLHATLRNDVFPIAAGCAVMVTVPNRSSGSRELMVEVADFTLSALNTGQMAHTTSYAGRVHAKNTHQADEEKGVRLSHRNGSPRFNSHCFAASAM